MHPTTMSADIKPTTVWNSLQPATVCR